ncbi:MAG: inositol monophosphatase [Patescibacteria group bacterium]
MYYQAELDFAKNLAENAGKIMNRYFLSQDMGTTWKKDNTPITVADTMINDLVISEVKKHFPKHGVLGEESSYKPERPMIWVVDPIDGTMPFSAGIPVCTFSLALVDRATGQSVIGVVFDPFLKHLYTSVINTGAFLNDKQIKTSKITTLKSAYLSVIGGSEDDIFKPGKCLDLMRDTGAQYLSMMSSVYSASKVATGDLAGGVFGYGSPWDSAAVSLLVQEAGGKVTDLEGKPRRYDEWGNGCVFAANDVILSKLLDIISKSSSKS